MCGSNANAAVCCAPVEDYVIETMVNVVSFVFFLSPSFLLFPKIRVLNTLVTGQIQTDQRGYQPHGGRGGIGILLEEQRVGVSQTEKKKNPYLVSCTMCLAA